MHGETARILLRSILLAAIARGCDSPTVAAESLTWQPFSEAVERAKLEKKLLMVVQGPDDVTLADHEGRTARSYRLVTLSDTRVKDFYQFRVVPTYRPTGPPRLVSSTREKESSGPSHANVVTYFCGVDASTEKPYVMHFVVGFPTALWLQTECDWAFTLLDTLGSQPTDSLRTTIADAHRRRLAMLGESVPLATKRAGLVETLRLAAKYRDQQLLARYGAAWTPAEQVRFVGSLRPHAELQAAASHQVLSWYPCVDLEKLDKPAFEQLTRQVYWAPPTRREALRKWFVEQQKRQRPLVVIVSAESGAYTGDDKWSDQFQATKWRARRRAVRLKMRDFDSVVVNRTELICIYRDFDLTLFDQKTFNDLGYVVFAPRLQDAWHVEKDDELKLLRMMKKAVDDDSP